MRLSIKTILFAAATLIAVVIYSGCTSDDTVKSSDLSLESRGLINGTPQSTALVGLTGNNELVSLMSGPPVQELATYPITGLRDGEFIMAIDIRPKTGEIFGVSNQSVIYRLKDTGGAEAVSGLALVPAITGTVIAFDINPADDLIRVMTDGGQFLRVSPLTGGVVGQEPAIPGLTVNSMAYTTPGIGYPNALYLVDIATSTLYKQSRTGAPVEYVGPLGYLWTGDGGFAISKGNLAFSVQNGHSTSASVKGTLDPSDNTGEDAFRLYSINIKTGAAQSYGRLSTRLIGVAVQ